MTVVVLVGYLCDWSKKSYIEKSLKKAVFASEDDIGSILNDFKGRRNENEFAEFMDFKVVTNSMEGYHEI